ncbi:MAG: bifunctional phosphoribosylaminoimidazolecarboxamide formyltransferase/IMP cyclohydrolase [Planctomycetota bacterium]
MADANERWAFLSVRDTTGVVDFARGLIARGFRLVATPGTRRILESAEVETTCIEDVTGFPVILDGIVKSVHPRIFAGVLVNRDDAEAVAACAEHSIPLFELVVVNCPGHETVDGDYAGGPDAEVPPLALVRAAASNHRHCLVVTKPEDYPGVLAQLSRPDGPDIVFRRRLAREAWSIAIHHDIIAAHAFEDDQSEPLPPVLRGEYRRLQLLRYGENPHQTAALYASANLTEPSVAGARLLAGAPLSYNNIVDADVGLNLALEFAAPGAVIVKHAMPASAAIGMSVGQAVEKAFGAEWAARIGAAVACNGVVDAEAARGIAEPGRSIDLVIGSDFTADAIEILRNTPEVSGEMRLLKAGDMSRPAGTGRRRRVAMHHVSGGILAQTIDDGVYGPGGFHVATERVPTDDELIDLEFACLVAKHTRSHSSVLAHRGATIAVASVQTNRAEASHIALERAGGRAAGTVMASDSNVNLAEVAMLIEAGIRAIIHTGGSPEEDAPLVEACNTKDVAMIVTRMRHFNHV